MSASERMGSRISGGQFASSQARVSERKDSRSVIELSYIARKSLASGLPDATQSS
jgi:hypothetical protein